MRSYSTARKRRRERGQTLVLVAVSLVVLVSMAALAIDLTTLYEARTEMQRAADAAALAGAETFVYSGTTTDPTNTNLQALATNMANASINSLLAKNTVGGVVPVLVSDPIDFSRLGNPQITVTLQRADVPTFFAHIFGRRLATVTASATAEAYNSSLPPGGGGSMPPVAPSCVKPWLIPNVDPDHGGGTAPFVGADGSITNPGVWTGGGGGIIGERIILNNICPVGGACLLSSILTGGLLDSPGYLPAKLAAAGGTCSSCSVGGDNFGESINCCDTQNAYSCAGTTNVFVDLLHNNIAGTLAGAACLLTGAPNSGATPGQDTIDFADFQSNNGPIEITAGGGPYSGTFVTTSNQIVTVPIIDNTPLDIITGQVKVIGFMQAFVVRTVAGGILELHVLNISGCGTNINLGATPVSGGGVSPVPVRLIHNSN